MDCVTAPEPLIAALTLAADAQRHSDRLRAAHFPPERNYLAAHVTLCHALPSDRLAAVSAVGLHAELAATFQAWTVGAKGLAVWRYLGGPWEPVDRYAFDR